LHPLRFKASQWEDLNNSSLVIKLTLGRISFLFTGDIEREAETVIIRSEDNLKSTVIKVPHHGSMTSSTAGFLKKVKPGFAVFSVGYHNGLGFPHGKIIRRYEKFGCKIYRTDRDGAVMMTTDGADLKIKTFGKTTTEFARLKK
jgi:competence protein ComEC